MDNKRPPRKMQVIRCSFMPTNCRLKLMTASHEADAFIADHSASSQPQAAAVSWPSVLARRHGSILRVRRPQAQRGRMVLRAWSAGGSQQIDQLAGVAFQICPYGQAAARLAVASGLAGFSRCVSRDRQLFHRSRSSACCCCRMSLRPSAWRSPTVASERIGCAAVRS